MSSSDDPARTPSNKSAFEAIAQAYELLVNEESRWARERVFLERWIDDVRRRRASAPTISHPNPDLNSTPTPASPRVLDAGCGTGFHARHIARHLNVEHVVGADPSCEMLDVASRKPGGDRVQWIQAPAENPPPGPFDLVLLLGNTLSLIEPIERVLAGAAAVVEPGGVFVIQMLDYERMREQGFHPRRTERSSDHVRIAKELAPRRDGGPVAANLSLTVFDARGRVISRERHALYEHSESNWLPIAYELGWSLEARRSRYDEEDGENADVDGGEDDHQSAKPPGHDRIFILRRG